MTRIKVLMLAMLVSVSACEENTAPTPAGASKESELLARPASTSTVSNTESAVIQIAVPTPQDVLKAIYKNQGEGTAEYKLKDGRYVHFWYGHRYSLNQKNYFVGFADAAKPTNKATDDEYPDPAEQVTISQATYEQVGNLWQIINTHDGIGKFGAKRKSLEPFSNKKPQTFNTKSGKYLLAVPVWSTEMGGIEMQSSEIFSFSAEEKKWLYLGNVYTGENDNANCVDATTPSGSPCSASTGMLEFIVSSDNDTPAIKVIRNGTQIDNNRHLITLTDKDALDFVFDSNKFQYLKIN